METIGDKLKAARNAKKLTIRDVVKQTNINPVYVKALEEEEFDKFPSETYLIGFLRSYSQYLKLDTEDIIQGYRGYKIGESATPLEELTKPTKPSIAMVLSPHNAKFKNAVFAIVVIVSVFAIYMGVRTIMSSNVDISGSNSIDIIKNEYKEKNTGTRFENIRTLQLNNDKGIILVYKNEGVQFLIDNKEVFFQLKGIKGSSINVEFLPGEQSETFEIDKSKKINIKGSPRGLTLTLKGLTENRAKIFVQLDKKISVIDEKIAEDFNKKEIENIDVVAINKKNLKIVFEAIFRQKSFIEIYLDGTMKKRGFFPKGSIERWEAAEYIQIKVGNAGGLRVKINGRKYNFGKLGQVANKIIKWKRDVKNPNLYHIVVKDW